jgi:hypothetical protein
LNNWTQEEKNLEPFTSLVIKRGPEWTQQLPLRVEWWVDTKHISKYMPSTWVQAAFSPQIAISAPSWWLVIFAIDNAFLVYKFLLNF